jgi:thiamine pyrophosphokinase
VTVADVAIVVAGGPRRPGASRVPPGVSPVGALIVAADSGLDRARAMGLRVDLVVGDMDSVGRGTLGAAAAAGTKVEEHPEAKDATDLEQALDAARAGGARRLVVIGSDGGRLDHVLAIATLLAAPAYAAASVEAWLGSAHLTVVRDAEVTLTGRAGDLVTLLPMHGRAAGVTTDGLLYPLAGEDLVPGTTRGVSNELVGERATVRVRAGVVVAVQPGEQGTHAHRGLGPAGST